MICPSCSQHNNDDVRFCRHCGGKMERRSCANGHTIPDGLTECPYCPRGGAAVVTPTPGGRRAGTVMVSDEDLVASGVAPTPQADQPATAEAEAMPPTEAVAAPPPTPRPPTEPASARPASPPPPAPARAAAPRSRTMVGSPGKPLVEAPAGPRSVDAAGETLLVGFVVSFVGEPNGVFWPLRVGRTRIGSAADCEVVLGDPHVSGRHAMIVARSTDDGVRVWCEDSGSQNGTLLNGFDIFNERPELSSGDVLRAGPIELRVLLLG
jgi:hypothetical protein